MFLFTRFRIALFSVFLFTSVATTTVGGGEPPRSWLANQLAPLTLERIAALPEAKQPAWKAYWNASRKLTAKHPAIETVEYSPSQPITGPPLRGLYSKGLRLDAQAAWYSEDEARMIADHVVTGQTIAGAWTKGNDYAQSNPQTETVEGNIWNRGTFDNEATTSELRFLALVNAAAPDDSRSAAWRKSFLRGLGYIFACQFPNGGFPQIYPLAGGYHDNITFNDDAMLRVLQLLRDVAAGKPEFSFIPARLRKEAQRRMESGVRCILATQIKTADGQRTVWGQQYDPLTLQPAAARNFEPIGLAARESAYLTEFLMSLPNPSPEIVAAVDDAMVWFRRTPIHNITWNRFTNDARVVASSGTPPMWARLTELNTDKPIFGDRDRTIHYDVSELSDERRTGYAWYGEWPIGALKTYQSWRKAAGPVTASTTASRLKFTYVIVHGAWGGGWAFKEVDRLLTADGHKVYRPTLTGQGERVHLANSNINLSLHIQDIVNVIQWEKLHDIVLVGHSYGGMVVTGVADRVPDRIQHLIYLDAFVPEHGEYANAIRGSTGLDRPIKDGFVIPTWLKGNEPLPHDVPHPLKTLDEPITLTNQTIAQLLPTTYILTVDKGMQPERDNFYRFYERAKRRGWPTLIMEADHNPQWSHPKELVELLETAAHR